MNTDVFEGKWKELKGKAQAKWGKLTDDDVKQVHGKREQLAGCIQKRYGIAKDEADRKIDEWMKHS